MPDSDKALQAGAGPAPEELAAPHADGLLRVLRLKPGLRFMELACGGGGLFFRAFEAMDGRGVFFAADARRGMLPGFSLRLRAFQDHPGFAAIRWVQSRPGRVSMPDASLDRLVVAQGYHAVEDRPALLREAARLLCPGGLFCLSDWRGAGDDPTPEPGPPLQRRVGERQAVEEMRQAGFSPLVSHAGFPHHWCLTARKG